MLLIAWFDRALEERLRNKRIAKPRPLCSQRIVASKKRAPRRHGRAIKKFRKGYPLSCDTPVQCVGCLRHEIHVSNSYCIYSTINTVPRNAKQKNQQQQNNITSTKFCAKKKQTRILQHVEGSNFYINFERERERESSCGTASKKE